MPNTVGDAYIQPMLDYFGVPVVVGGTTVNGVYDVMDVQIVDVDGTLVVGRENVVKVKTGTLPGLAQGVAITVDGISFTVISAHEEQDGKTTIVRLKKA